MTIWDSSATPIAATFSKSRRFFAKEFTPTALKRGVGANVYGNDGQWYTDWISGLGAITLGHAHTGFCDRVAKQVYEGIGFSLPHVLEAWVADKIAYLLGIYVPGWTPEGLGVRFGLSGTDATTMAVRLARAVTRRDWILSLDYHGWADWSVSVTPPAWGIPKGQCVTSLEFGNLLALEAKLTVGLPVAAVIMEHLMIEPPKEYYPGVRRLCDKHGALFILDEVVTWPRYGLGGAAEIYGIEPDIVCLGKGLGNGMPISCMVGRREYFDWFARNDPCFVSSTHFGNAVSLAAADAVLDLWTQDCVDHIWRIGQSLMDGLREAGYKLTGNPPRFLIDFPTLSHKTYFVLGMRDRQILWNRPTLPNLAHTLGDVDKTVMAASEIMMEMDAIGKDEIEIRMKDHLPMVLFRGR
ncbi:MAG: aminotransferase class III-fold pyridoxal phosphate-dependent enzyme [Chloroflexi bacterium]|nr:aminotransferase class III-fold pyridoxal phosphate-dependent enzyme [Chloroflexota bacterium]